MSSQLYQIASLESDKLQEVCLALTWSRDGTMLASAHSRSEISKGDTCVKLWRPCSKKKTNKESSLSGVVAGGSSSQSSTTASSSSYLVVGGGEEEGLICFDGGEWECVQVLKGVHERTVRSLSFAPGNKVLATASFDGTVGIWERLGDTWECTAQLEGHESEVKCVVFNSTGTLLATCGRDKSIWIWECFLPIQPPGARGDTNTSGGVEFECIAVLHGHEGDVKSITFAPSNGQFGDGDEVLYSASYDDTIRCWAEDAGDWYCAATLSAHSSTVWSIAPAPGGARLVSGSDDCSLGVWKCYTAKEARELKLESKVPTDGAWKCVGKLPDAHDYTIYSVDYAPSSAGHGRIASVGADESINIYKEIGGASDAPLFDICAHAKKAHCGDINCVRWNPKDGSIIATAGDDGCIKVWKYELQ